MGTSRSSLFFGEGLDASRIMEICETVSEAFVLDFRSAVQDDVARSSFASSATSTRASDIFLYSSSLSMSSAQGSSIGVLRQSESPLQPSNTPSSDFNQSFDNSFGSSRDFAPSVHMPSHSLIAPSVFDRSYALHQAPDGSHILKNGLLFLLGPSGWRLRQFTAMNKIHNYRIVYSKEKQRAEIKGQITLCGYKVENFSTKEKEEHGTKDADLGELGIKLVPYDPRKPVWMFKASTEEDHDTWFEIFTIACNKSMPVVVPGKEPVVAIDDNQKLTHLFNVTFRRTRAIYGKYDLFPMKGTEIELLVNLLLQIVQGEIIDEYCYQYPSDERDIKFKQATESALKLIEPMASKTWIERCLPIWSEKVIYQKDIQFIKSYIDVSMAVERSLGSRVKQIITPVLNDISIRLLRPVLHACADSAKLAYQEAIIGCNIILLAFIENIIADPALDISLELKSVDNTVNYIGSGPLLNSQKILQLMMKEGLGQMYDVFDDESSQFTKMDVYFTFIDGIRAMLRNAIATFDSFINETIEIDINNEDGTTSRVTLTEYLKEASNNLEKARSARTISKDRSASYEGYDDTDSYKKSDRIFSQSSNNSGGSVDIRGIPSTGGSVGQMNRANMLKKFLTFENEAVGNVNARAKMLISKDVQFDRKYVKLVLVELLNDIITKLTHDAILSLKTSLLTVLYSVSFSNVQEYVIFPCNDIASSALRDLRDDGNILNEFNLYCICTSICQKTVKEFMNNNVDQVWTKSKNHLKDVSNQVKNYNYSKLG